jgi:TetR/AcrR family transcriptional regulator, lmrAB and yxaGH operons repressor
VPRDSKDRMVRSAASLIGSRGVSATSFTEVLAASGSPRGSIYYHFPSGKEQLTRDAVQLVAGHVLARQASCRATTPRGVLDCFIGMWREVVVASHGSAGCAVAGVAVDTTPDQADLLDLVRASFRSWVDLLADQFAATGLHAGRCRPVAVATVAGLEGALILCRAERGVAPLDTVARELARLLPGRGRED